MPENKLSVDLMERLTSVDNKLEKLLASQSIIEKETLTRTRNPADPTCVKEILPDPPGDDDIPEAFEDAEPYKDTLSLRTTVSEMEADTIFQKVQKINSNAEVLERVEKLEGQYRKITILGSMVMTLMVLMIAVFTFIMVHGSRGVFVQASQMAEPSKALSTETTVKVNNPKPAEPVTKAHDLQTDKPVAMESELKPGELVVPIVEPQKTQKTETIAPVKYVGSITSNKYHYPNCEWAAKIKPYKLRTFSSVNEAREMGYIPCPTCRPPQSDQ